MDIREHIDYWLDSAEHDFESAESLLSAGKYDWCLFISHIVLEKTLKALYVSVNDNQFPPKIHNLVRLAELSGLDISDEIMDYLDRVNDFNIDARYPDYKFSFYTTCTREFALENFKRINELRIWIKSRIK